MKRLAEPAFSKANQFISLWIIVAGFLFIVIFGGMEIIIDDPPKELAIAESNLRHAVFQRMRAVCFTEEQIQEYWYDQEFYKYPNKLLIIIKGREALCGGRGLCGCEAKERPADFL